MQKLMHRLNKSPNTIPKHRQNCNPIYGDSTKIASTRDLEITNTGPLAYVCYICSSQNY